MRAGAIESQTGAKQNEELSDLKEEIDRLQLGLNANAYHGAAAETQNAKLKDCRHKSSNKRIHESFPLERK